MESSIWIGHMGQVGGVCDSAKMQQFSMGQPIPPGEPEEEGVLRRYFQFP